MSSQDSHDADPTWYRDAIIYEVRVGSFFDSDDDGAGDFPGLIRKLDYIADLGATAIWLLPFYPSPLRDDGYDIADYLSIHPELGRLEDFKRFLREAHRRGMRVITELVLNHTSDRHAWFQRARRAPPRSRHRNFYVWSETDDRYPEARVIFQDFERSNWTWDPVAKAYYWHRFYSHQPDLNFDNPEVRREMFRVVDFWLALGVDGLRLDAVPYLIERDGTGCENLPETHEVLRELRAHIDARFRGRMLLAEANQWPEDAVAYFGRGDECHMAFHFPIMPRMFMATQMEDRYPLVDALVQTPAIPRTCQWALFLRNHDELTLEMVTDEERDYMYRVFAQEPGARLNQGIRRRLAPLLGNDRRRIELMYALLLSLPGTPVLYYGDEIGMGDNFHLGDRNGVRTPMQWCGDRNAGFSKANPQKLALPVVIDPEYHYEAVNVEAQHANPHSLLWFVKRLVALRKNHPAFGRGTLELLYPKNAKVLAFLRRHEEQQLLVLANLSRFTQPCELELSALSGWTPVELSGQTRFPRIEERPYPLTLGPRGFCWFALEPPRPLEMTSAAERGPGPVLEVRRSWVELTSEDRWEELASVVSAARAQGAWFWGEGSSPGQVRVLDAIPMRREDREACLLLVGGEPSEDRQRVHWMVLACGSKEELARSSKQAQDSAMASVRFLTRKSDVILYDGIHCPWVREELLLWMGRRRRIHGQVGELRGSRTSVLTSITDGGELPGESVFRVPEQSYAVVAYGGRALLKLYRGVEPGLNPDLEVGRFLGERAGFPYVPPTAGHLEYVAGRGPALVLAVLQAFVPSEGDGWSLALGHLGQFFERVLAASTEPVPGPLSTGWLDGLVPLEVPGPVRREVGAFLELIRVLGRRTAEMHRALSETEAPDFCVEPFTSLYQRSLYQSARNSTSLALGRLRESLDSLSVDVRAAADRLLAMELRLLEHFRRLVGPRISAVRSRIHGDFDLRHVLYTGKSFCVVDFEGDTSRPPGERRLKRSPLRDVASMLESIHHAAHSALRGPRSSVRASDVPAMIPWARAWADWVSAVYLHSYLANAAPRTVPSDPDQLRVLLLHFLLERSLLELEQVSRQEPEQLRIPLDGLLRLLDAG
ncbi:MAG: maltose alpha-D-glucosyltransferase [Candidatus Wallbacteria bacterium]|nr:maltose alpha-D-glucosyltransferase [Candidatus Wallbacteria bacterium]